jgi:hypothetical protein
MEQTKIHERRLEMSDSLASCVVAVYNGAGYLALLAQTPGSLELIALADRLTHKSATSAFRIKGTVAYLTRRYRIGFQNVIKR